MNIKHYCKLWKTENTNKEAIEKFWDIKAYEFNKIINNKENSSELINFLYSKNIISNDSKVLDIGCGTGKHSVEIAKRCSEVTAIDISNKMLEFAKNNAKQNDIENINFKKAFWDELDLKNNGFYKEFDLVFAAMCPGINNYETLNKMMNASKKYCFMSAFVERSDFLWDELNQYLRGTPIKQAYDKKIYYSFNILYLRGYYPKIKYIDRKWDNIYSLDSLVDEYMLRFEMKQKLTNIEKEKIYDYLKCFANDGYVRESVKSKIAWMYWEV